VVIADEHHAYYDRRSQTPSRARRGGHRRSHRDPELPNEAGRDHLPYTLGQAIADGLVKVPMLVGRKDDRRDTETQLADGLVLLNAKREAVESWCEHTGAVQ